MPTDSAKKTTNDIEYGGVKLPLWTGKKHALIPTKGAEIWYSEEQTKAIATALKSNIACLLIGETGTGKTSILRDLAHKRKQPYLRVNMNGYTSPDELIGSKSAQKGSTFFEDGVIIQAMREGMLLVMDEINATPPDCLFLLHSLLDDERKITLPTGEVVTPHPEFRFFATMNPDYAGTKGLNAALTDRFGIILQIDPMDAEKEKDYLVKQGIKEDHADIMVQIALRARESYALYKNPSSNKKATPLPIFISTRTLLQWGDLVKEGISFADSFRYSVVNKVTEDEDVRSALRDLYFATVKQEPDSDNVTSAYTVISTQKYQAMEKTVKQAEEKLKHADTAFAMERAELVGQIQGLAKKLKDAEQAGTSKVAEQFGDYLSPQIGTGEATNGDYEEGEVLEEITMGSVRRTF